VVIFYLNFFAKLILDDNKQSRKKDLTRDFKCFLPYFAGVLSLLKYFCEMSCGRLDGCYSGHVMKQEMRTCKLSDIWDKVVCSGRFSKWGVITYYFDKDMKEIGFESEASPNVIFINQYRVWSEWGLEGLTITKLK